ncbi:MAG TPA: EamA family transporter [Longimicrobiaceae bacterium]|jgi:drug/metabolite transporter (DMT)-like permease|nr:EamA family transporter [Longimicrobiaceae bacterium]
MSTDSPAVPLSPSIADGGRARRFAGYGLALTAGALWGMTGPISEALYKEGANITEIGFWRVLLAVLGFLAYGCFRPAMFRIDRRGVLVIALGGGALVAAFEVAFQHAISNLGVAAAVTLLYTAPVMITLLAGPLLKERVTAVRVALALVVLAGVAMTVFGAQGAKPAWNAVGIVGGMVAAVSYAGTTLLARYVVPRYGSLKMLFWELLGGTVILAVLLPLVGRPLLPGGAFPAWMQSTQPWIFIVALGISTVVLANFAFFGATKRIDAAPTAVGASCEPVVGSLAALAIFGQNLTPLGWAGLALVVSGVVTGYLREARETDEEPNAPRG